VSALNKCNYPKQINIEVTECPGSVVEILFSDSGTGISKEQQMKLFDIRFTTKSSGSGIGLNIVRETLMSRGGIIHFVPEIQNTTFKIVLY
jgi:signal transduction histidine kinase